MPNFLTLRELQFFTGAVRPSKIVRELDYMQIPYKTTSSGQIRVLETDVQTFSKLNFAQKQSVQSWEPNL